MSRSYATDENSYHVATNMFPGIDYPLTMQMWFKLPEGASAFPWPVYLVKEGSGSEGFRFEMSPGNGRISAKVENGAPSGGAASPEFGYTTETWNQGLGEFPLVNVRTAYINNSPGTPDGATVPMTGIEIGTMLIGNWWVGSIVGMKLAEIAIWNRTLTSGEKTDLLTKAASLAAPTGLIFYLSMKTSSLTDTIGSKVFTGGTWDADHPTLEEGGPPPPTGTAGINLLLGVG